MPPDFATTDTAPEVAPDIAPGTGPDTAPDTVPNTVPNIVPGANPLGVAIIGAGFGGIGMAIRLKQQGRTDFLVFEQADDIGGTWRDNHYPGCACDIPASLYSFSFATNGRWSRRYPTQPEILAYLRACVDRFGVRSHLRLGLGLVAARFDAGTGLWQLSLTDGSAAAARALVVSVGQLHTPFVPDLPNLESFAGPRFHSACWDHAVDLGGKRVAVIGSGASAVQFVPRIAEQAASVTVYQRTAPWILPKRDPVNGLLKRSVMARCAPARRLARAWTFLAHDWRAVGFVWAPWLLTAVERRARSFAKRELANGDVRTAVTPDYRIGCKRILLSNDFLAALNRPTVAVVTDPIASVSPTSVVTADGSARPADVLVFATGFRASQPLSGVCIIGPSGQSLADAWRDGMAARLGVAVAGFPNLFLLGGPNTSLGHNSVVFMLEAQIGHILRCLRRLGGHRALDVRPEAQARFLAWLDRRMRRTVWLSGCRSWYLDRSGRNTTLWPGFAAGYWLRMRQPIGEAYRVTPRNRIPDD
ncbi:MAG TPA: NAD(P)/FAD-dependent oxidoreductase [Rhodopila sp.]|uniref:flavin-containing monooxygenase n=1 Tax=Rhodopila sp. TaxID=2480087 RepID=UPI002BD8E951|nr:NAD(P)/FAD-dependent oxidoreductase [Rhodopila sp.]HVY14695.1 NAD(P)/FAD-dependent oxidoreductase [Rhodopila sp.]